MSFSATGPPVRTPRLTSTSHALNHSQQVSGTEPAKERAEQGKLAEPAAICAATCQWGIGSPKGWPQQGAWAREGQAYVNLRIWCRGETEGPRAQLTVEWHSPGGVREATLGFSDEGAASVKQCPAVLSDRWSESGRTWYAGDGPHLPITVGGGTNWVTRRPHIWAVPLNYPFDSPVCGSMYSQWASPRCWRPRAAHELPTGEGVTNALGRRRC